MKYEIVWYNGLPQSQIVDCLDGVFFVLDNIANECAIYEYQVDINIYRDDVDVTDEVFDLYHKRNYEVD